MLRSENRYGKSLVVTNIDVSFELFLQERGVLPLFELQGFRFYLLAYMLFTVEDFEEADTIPEGIVLSLKLRDAGREPCEFIPERLVRFSEEQRMAILNFWEYPE